jgi:hypothetical protein
MSASKKADEKPQNEGFKGDNPVDNGVFLAGQLGKVVEVSGDGRFYEQHLAGDRTRSAENAS